MQSPLLNGVYREHLRLYVRCRSRDTTPLMIPIVTRLAYSPCGSTCNHLPYCAVLNFSPSLVPWRTLFFPFQSLFVGSMDLFYVNCLLRKERRYSSACSDPTRTRTCGGMTPENSSPNAGFRKSSRRRLMKISVSLEYIRICMFEFVLMKHNRLTIVS